MKILVVDDEKDVQMLFEQRFRREIRNGEMSFIFAFSGEEALLYLSSHDAQTGIYNRSFFDAELDRLELLRIEALQVGRRNRAHRPLRNGRTPRLLTPALIGRSELLMSIRCHGLEDIGE